MPIEKIIPGYHYLRDKRKTSGPLIELILYYHDIYEDYSKKNLIDLFLNLEEYHEKAIENFASDPQECLRYLDNMRVIEYIILNKPIGQFKEISDYLKVKLQETKNTIASLKIGKRIKLLKKYIKRAQNYQKKK